MLIADEHPLFRAALVRLVEGAGDLRLAAEVGTGREALVVADRLAPDVAVVDAELTDLPGARVAWHLRSAGSSTRVLVLAAEGGGHQVHEALAAGARGYVSKRARREEVLGAIRRLAGGGIALDAQAGVDLADELHRRRALEQPTLSDREREVLRLLAEGRSVAQIGEALHVSPATVKTHLQTLYGKLGVSERAAAVAVAMRRDLLA